MSGAPFDLLRWPIVGPFLRWRHARTSLQLVLLLAAAVVVVNGLVGPAIAPSNLSTVLTWVHYRGLLIVALLAVGNVFCTGCPFVLVRDAGRRLRAPGMTWPRRLRTKWMAVALVGLVLFAYELFDLWALPRATAWLVLGYFAAALLVDLVFTGATFCKYLCPVGQFSFIASTLSPLEIRVRQLDTCRSCHTVDCIKGRREPTAPEAPAAPAVPAATAVPAVVRQRGCELALFLPSKVGNLDCTFCLDCVHACPHDNVAIGARVPGLELVEAGRRSGVGWITRRPDLVALSVVFVFGGLVNAFGMIAPARAAEDWLRSTLGVSSEAAALATIFLVGLVAAPLVILGSAAAASDAVASRGLASRDRRGAAATASSYVFALVPLGCGIWLAHYGFHLLTGILTIVPVSQSAAIELTGRPLLGDPLWTWTGFRPGAVLPLEIGAVLLGAIGAAALAYLVSERDSPSRAVAATIPWVVAIAGLASLAIWILIQPMQMRGLGVSG
jgi:polyferredoxin